jgi:hypothetical protein
MGFDEIQRAWDWRPIRGCAGRLVLGGVGARLRPEEILGPEVEIAEFKVSGAKDVVLVARLDCGGIISYRREDGSFVHTLNTEEGFERKLRQLQIELPGELERGRTRPRPSAF